MKICPNCAFANEERFPACLLCNTLLVDVRSTPCTDPKHPEFAQQALNKERRQITRGQVRAAILLYAAVITLTAACPGLIFSVQTLLCYFGGGAVVGLAVGRGIIGQFSAGLVQGLCSLLLVFYFGPFHPLTFFMFIAHIIAPSVLSHWVEMIDSLNR
jgi:hypothetical protein